MTDIELRNENGVIVGYDAETGDKVSVSFESLDTAELNGVRYAGEFSGANGGERIQAAIDDLPASGGTVVIGPEGPDSGLWEVSTEITVPSNVTLTGEGMFSTRVKLADGADAIVFDVTGSSDVEITDMEIDGNRANQTNDSNTHVELILSDSGSHNITIQRIYGHDAVNAPVNFELDEDDRHSDVTVTECILDNNATTGESGYRPGEDLIELKTVDNATVTDNILRQCWKTAVELERTKHANVDGNVCISCGSSTDATTIRVETANSTTQTLSENITISNNVLEDNYNEGISVGGGKDVVVDGNTVQGSDGPALNVSAANGVDPTDVSVTDNVIDPGDQDVTGLRIFDLRGGKVADNTVRNAYDGLKLDNCTGIDVTNNTIRDSGSVGLFVLNGSGGHHVADNRIEEYGLTNATDGFQVKDPDCTVTDNRVEHSVAKAYLVSGERCVVRGNWSDVAPGVAWRFGSFSADTLVRDNSPEPNEQTYSGNTPSLSWAVPIILLDGASNSIDAVLPDPAAHGGATISVKATDVTNTVRIRQNGSETIDGSAEQTFAAANDSYQLQSDGTDWHIVGGLGA